MNKKTLHVKFYAELLVTYCNIILKFIEYLSTEFIQQLLR